MKKLAIAGLVLTLMAGLLGCDLWPGGLQRPEEVGEQGDTPPISPQPPGAEVTITLYVSDAQSLGLVPEERVVVQGDEALEELILRELLAGPADPDLRRTVPEGTRLISVDNVDGVAYVNFSREFVEHHPGGSTGEWMTIDAVVFSLTELPEVEKVQFLVEGLKVETLAGHMSILEPLAREVSRIGRVMHDLERLKRVQARVDAGKERWRLDPLEVARRDGRALGFSLQDSFELLSREEEGAAVVKAEHNGRTFHIHLIQPLKRGDDFIWVIDYVEWRR